jgi:hypothetical protein
MAASTTNLGALRSHSGNLARETSWEIEQEAAVPPKVRVFEKRLPFPQ